MIIQENVMKRKIHVRRDEEIEAIYRAAHYGPVPVPPELAERMGIFQETAIDEEDVEPAYEVDRILDQLEEEERTLTELGGE